MLGGGQFAGGMFGGGMFGGVSSGAIAVSGGGGGDPKWLKDHKRQAERWWKELGEATEDEELAIILALLRLRNDWEPWNN